MRITQFIALVGLLASTANAGPYDKEYNQARMAAYEAARTHFLDQVRTLWFAVGCGAIGGLEIMPLYSVDEAAIGEAMNEGPGNDPQLGKMLEKAKQEGYGMARDRVHHVCGYWRDHPEALYELRQEAAEAGRAAFP